MALREYDYQPVDESTSVTFVNINLDINFRALVSCVSAKLGLKTMNIFSCTDCHSNYRRDLLDRISSAVIIDLGSLSSTVLCNLLLYGDSHFCLDTNRFIIESTLSIVKGTSHFKQIQTNQSVLTCNDSIFCLLFLFTVHVFLFDSRGETSEVFVVRTGANLLAILLLAVNLLAANLLANIWIFKSSEMEQHVKASDFIIQGFFRVALCKRSRKSKQ